MSSLSSDEADEVASKIDEYEVQEIRAKRICIDGVGTEFQVRTTVEDEEGENEECDEDFKCGICSTVQGLNNCEMCDKENECEECYGKGGDYGPNEIWVCHGCVPTCLECEAPLYTANDKCCGKGRSDEEERKKKKKRLAKQ